MASYSEEIEKLFDYKLDGRIQFIIYNKLGDAKQSNIGLETEEDNTSNTGGSTRIVGNKVFLYFTAITLHFINKSEQELQKFFSIR